MKEQVVIYGSGEVARLLGIGCWKLQYLIERGDLPGPSAVVVGRRLFTADDLEAIRKAYEARQRSEEPVVA